VEHRLFHYDAIVLGGDCDRTGVSASALNLTPPKFD
jgi:hypothetical protein